MFIMNYLNCRYFKKRKKTYIIEHGGHHQKIRTIGDCQIELKKIVSG